MVLRLRTASSIALTRLALVVTAAHGCSSSSDALVTTRTDSAGVEIVLNAGPDRPLDWTFSRVRTIGGADSGPEAFFELSDAYVATDAGGRIYVLDPTAYRVVAFDSAGGHLWSAGTQGEGPGELDAPIAVVSTAEGRVSVVDAGGMKIEHYGADGRYEGGERIESPPWMSQFGRSGDALVVDERPVLMSDDARERLLLITDVDTTELASARLEPRRRLQFQDCPIGIAMPPILGVQMHWTASGPRVAAATGPDYTVSLFDGGSRTHVYRRDLRPVASTPELAAAEVPDGMRLGAGSIRCEVSSAEAVEKRGFGPLVPLIRGLTFESDGTLWVQRTRADDHRADFDVLGADGAYLGSLSDAPGPLDFLPGGRLLAIETDALDVDRLVIYEILGR